MKTVSGETSEERKLVLGIQEAAGRKQDNYIGPDTLAGLAQMINAKVFPLDVKLYGCDTLISKEILLFDPNGPLTNWAYTSSGSYSHQDKPSSILVNAGKTVCGFSAQAWLGLPDSVIFEYYDGTIGAGRYIYDSEIPNRKDVKWAVGGAGLLGQFNPKAEGYCKFKDKDGVSRDYSGVWRKTNHVIFGVNDLGYKYSIMLIGYGDNKLDGVSINTFIKNNFGLKYALKLDGGHIAARNGPMKKVNITQRQAYAIQHI